jgi:death on curing protein
VIVYLSVEQILHLHTIQLEHFGGRRGVRDRGALESAVGRPAATFGGDDLYPDLAGKTGALMHSLVTNHPFVDGNKRVGTMAAELFIEINGARLVASDEELEEISLAAARGELDADRLAIWFRQRITQQA